MYSLRIARCVPRAVFSNFAVMRCSSPFATVVGRAPSDPRQKAEWEAKQSPETKALIAELRRRVAEEKKKAQNPGVKATVAAPIDTTNYPFVTGPYQKVMFSIWEGIEGRLGSLEKEYQNVDELFAAAGVTDKALQQKVLAAAQKEIADSERANALEPAAEAEAIAAAKAQGIL